MDARLLDVLQLAREGRRETALLRLRAYVQAHPEDADAWVVLGKLAPEHKLALSALRRAVQLAPQNATARDALATLEAQVTASPEPPEQPESAAVAETPSELPVGSPVPDAPPRETEPEEATEFPEVPDRGNDAGFADAREAAADSGEESADAEPAPDTEFQALRDARAVVWPFAARKQKNRTLGALLDENRLTRQDLLWAAKEARNEDVRQASQVILEAIHRLTDVAMSPEDARLIAWPFRRLNRPLGKLVDAGTVKVKDLRRATWYAKDARLREAARVMLPVALKRREAENRKGAAQKPQQAEMPSAPATQQDEAAVQQVVSQSPPERGSNKTRAFVAQASAPGKSERSGAASDDAMTRPMPVIQGSDYLANEVQRRYRRNLSIAAVMLLLVLAGLVLVLALIVMAVVSHKTPALWLWPLVAVPLLPIFALSDRFVELWQEEQNFRRGQLGESEVARLLRLGLGADWTLFRNVKLPGSHVDIDMVLLGPAGVFALEVKAYTGNYRYDKQRFYRRTVMNWRRMQHNPGKQARASAGLLHGYITDTLNEDIWVEPRLVWVGPGDLLLEEPEVFVWFIAKLDQETERLRALPRKLSTEKSAALSGLLRGLCSTLR